MKACLWVIALCSVALADDIPQMLDRATIAKAVDAVKPDVATCGTKSKAKGVLKVAVKVAPSGALDSVSILTTPDQALGTCVLVAMKKLTFPATEKGGSFHYPFVF